MCRPTRSRGPLRLAPLAEAGTLRLAVRPLGAPPRAFPSALSTGRSLRRCAGQRLPEVQAGRDLEDDDGGDHPVDGHAEGRPPPRVGLEMGAVLPEVLQA